MKSLALIFSTLGRAENRSSVRLFLKLVGLLVVPAAAALVAALLGPKRGAAIRWLSLGAVLALLVLAVVVTAGFIQLREHAAEPPGHGKAPAAPVVKTFQPVTHLTKEGLGSLDPRASQLPPSSDAPAGATLVEEVVPRREVAADHARSFLPDAPAAATPGSWRGLRPGRMRGPAAVRGEAWASGQPPIANISILGRSDVAAVRSSE